MQFDLTLAWYSIWALSSPGYLHLARQYQNATGLCLSRTHSILILTRLQISELVQGLTGSLDARVAPNYIRGTDPL